MIGLANAGMEHRRRRRGAESIREQFRQMIDLGAFEAKNQAWLGTELPHAHGNRSAQPLGDSRGVLAQGAGQDKHRVEAAHLGEDGDGIGPRGGGVKQGAPRRFGAGEPHGPRRRVPHQGHAHDLSRALEHGENTRG
jgi:hypothetical protein